MFHSTYGIELSDEQRIELKGLARDRTLAAAVALRARMVLAMSEGIPYSELTQRFDTSTTTLTRWRKRFVEKGVPGLLDRLKKGRGHGITAKDEARILAATQKAPPKPLTHWTSRRLAKKLGFSHVTITRVWKRAGIKPHLVDSYMASPDPEFERKAADIIGLYLDPPAHAAVFCVDEKTAIQALDRTLPILPLSPGRAERHGFEYVRHGTLSLYAALEVHTGHVEGMTADRHTSEAFLEFLEQVLATQPEDREVHIVCDNLSAHKTKGVGAWIEAHPRVAIHYTPTYSSWLNQVEIWFSKIQRDLITRGVFTSKTDLRRKLMSYIRLHNRDCRPFRWAYRNIQKRIRVNESSVTGH
jgi:transposase